MPALYRRFSLAYRQGARPDGPATNSAAEQHPLLPPRRERGAVAYLSSRTRLEAAASRPDLKPCFNRLHPTRIHAPFNLAGNGPAQAVHSLHTAAQQLRRRRETRGRAPASQTHSCAAAARHTIKTLRHAWGERGAPTTRHRAQRQAGCAPALSRLPRPARPKPRRPRAAAAALYPAVPPTAPAPPSHAPAGRHGRAGENRERPDTPAGEQRI